MYYLPEARNKEEILQNELQDLDRKICNNDTFDQEILEKYEAGKEDELIKKLNAKRFLKHIIKVNDISALRYAIIKLKSEEYKV